MNARELAARVVRARSLDEARALAARVLGGDALDVKRALAKYRETHWGDAGSGAHRVVAMKCADPSQGILVKLGQLESIVYSTTKRGDPPGTFYQHEFARPNPVLAYSDGGLVILGGAYRVTWRGIED